jgi:hypothetical protein
MLAGNEWCESSDLLRLGVIEFGFVSLFQRMMLAETDCWTHTMTYFDLWRFVVEGSDFLFHLAATEFEMLMYQELPSFSVPQIPRNLMLQELFLKIVCLVCADAPLEMMQLLPTQFMLVSISVLVKPAKAFWSEITWTWTVTG